jgi:hypothetical protein
MNLNMDNQHVSVITENFSAHKRGLRWPQADFRAWHKTPMWNMLHHPGAVHNRLAAAAVKG